MTTGTATSGGPCDAVTPVSWGRNPGTQENERASLSPSSIHSTVFTGHLPHARWHLQGCGYNREQTEWFTLSWRERDNSQEINHEPWQLQIYADFREGKSGRVGALFSGGGLSEEVTLENEIWKNSKSQGAQMAGKSLPASAKALRQSQLTLQDMNCTIQKIIIIIESLPCSQHCV